MPWATSSGRAGRASCWTRRPKSRLTSSPPGGALVEVTDRLVQVGGAKPRAVQDRHGRQQPAARDVLAHEATKPLGLGAEPGGPDRSRTTHRGVQPPVAAVEVHPAADQAPPAARGQVQCPAEPLAGHHGIPFRHSPEPRFPGAAHDRRSSPASSRQQPARAAAPAGPHDPLIGMSWLPGTSGRRLRYARSTCSARLRRWPPRFSRPYLTAVSEHGPYDD